MPRPLAMLVDALEPGALNLCRAYREAGHDVTLINRGVKPAEGEALVRDLGKPSAVVDLYPPGRWRDERRSYLLNSLGHKAAQWGLGALAKPFLLPLFDARLARPVEQRLLQLVAESGAEVVYGFWGIGALPEQRALVRARPPPALVHHFETYPLGKALMAHPKPASPIEHETLGRLDGRIHASEAMERYLDVALRPVRGADKVLPGAWGSWACPRKQRPKLSAQDGVPHVVHMGVAPHRPGTHDDVGAELRAIAGQGIAVHAVEGFREEGVRNFPLMGLRQLLGGEVAEFATQFDAVVLLYRAPKGLQWFGGNYPARFQTSISAGIPAAVPRGIFGAVEAFIEQHGNGFVFDTAVDLAASLRDEAVMGPARKRAEELARTHRLDRFLPLYQDFLELALDLRAGAGPGTGSATLK